MTKPLLIYANVPFCNSKCHFCDWAVQVPVRDLRLGEQSSFNRISIGAQSFDDARLRRLGRAHAADQALTAVQDAH
ncbi:hypothetical protein [Nonomuraea sp. NPDC003709]|uniref:hypothetical protein n=1 Tax=Nonomuraea sp. NPDC003709 TaxID=3154450 RepID=UPI0033AF65A2